MGNLRLSRNWPKVGTITLLSVIALFPYYTLAQVTPDQTLGNENSTVNQIDALNERIDGGAKRGGNLFHSFQEFNINEGKGVYFANPQGVMNIFSRVTGKNASQILGRLGVLGESNLFLINPYGIIFGPNSSLDIRGSFVGTTANGIRFGEESYFSATDVQGSSLLSINPEVLIFNQLGQASGVIVNQGNLVVGKDLTLSAGELDLQGQLISGGNLTLEALNTIQIKDNVTNPFVAATQGQLLIQGNQKIDISILNHPDSGLFSGKDLVLRSATPVGGDAHYWSGGNFRIERLDGSLGDLVSFNDPVIRSLGDVVLNGYLGTSLHIIAGGSVTIPGAIIITGTDITGNSLQETVTLSDGSSLEIDGSSQPTLDIRAGVHPDAIVSSITPVLTPSTNADIILGTVLAQNADGLVLLTNQYKPNLTLGGGTITVNSILTNDGFESAKPTIPPLYQGNAGSVVIDARGQIVISNIIASSVSGNGGNITLLANDDIIFNPDASILSRGFAGGAITLKSHADILLPNGSITSFSIGNRPDLQGGYLRVNANNLAIGTDDKGIYTYTVGSTKAGDILIDIGNLNIAGGGIGSNAYADSGDTGDVAIKANTITLSQQNPNKFPPGGLFTVAIQNTSGNSGRLTIATNSLKIINNATLGTFAQGAGTAGDIAIKANIIELIGRTSPTDRSSIQSLSGPDAPQAQGNAGNLNIETKSLKLLDGASVSSTTFGQGNAGNITIKADTIEVIGRASFDPRYATFIGSENFLDQGVKPAEVTGNSGNLTLEAQNLQLLEGGFITTQAAGQADAGDITIKAEKIDLIGTKDQTSSIGTTLKRQATGTAGDINIKTDRLQLINGTIGTATFGNGNGGNLTIKASSILLVEKTTGDPTRTIILADVQDGKGTAGNINIETDRLQIFDGARISSRTFAEGDAGKVTIRANTIELSGTSQSGRPSGIFTDVFEPTSVGQGGEIILETHTLTLDAGSQISASSNGIGDAGDISIKTDTLSANSSSISTVIAQGATGQGGNIKIQANSLNLDNRSQITARSQTQGQAGNIAINVIETFQATNSDIITSATQSSGGSINITAGDIRLQGNSNIRTDVARGIGGGGDITLTANSILAFDDSDILAFAQGGRGGNINLNTPVFFGNGYQATDEVNRNPEPLDNNNLADINASGAVSGVISIPNLTFIQNSLFELPETLINTENLIANSCVVPNQQKAGTFNITGSEGLPSRPNTNISSPYPTGTVEIIPPESNSPPTKIVEPQGFYRLSNGQMVLSRKCF